MLVFELIALLGMLHGCPANGEPFISVESATSLVASGAFVLDARAKPEAPFLPGAIAVDWTDYRSGSFRTGRLDDDLAGLEKKLADLGLSNRGSVLVVGDGDKGWGEEGRIWWMLRYLGLDSVCILDGGVRAWVQKKGPTQKTRSEAHPSKALTLNPRPGLRVDWRSVHAQRKTPAAVLIDARERSEFDGATPYFEARGGHIPGAKSLPWRSLLTKEGILRPRSELIALFASLGITKDTPAVASYCTGGVRSAFVVAALHQVGIGQAANYDGSFWEWAGRDELPVE